MRTAMLFFLLLAFPMLSLAGSEKIEEGFGIKLGQEIRDENLPEGLNMERVDENDGEVIYSFIPEHPYGPLTEYLVFVTPASDRVYQIQALGHFKRRDNCVEELDILEKLLARKYGEKNYDASLQFTDLDVINFGDRKRKIIVKCSGFFSKHKLKLIYLDKELMKVARKEAKRPPGRGIVPTEGGERDAQGL